MRAEEQAYRALFDDLNDRRRAAGGTLPIKEESEAVARLEGLWWKLGPAEHSRIERDLLERVRLSDHKEPWWNKVSETLLKNEP